jgi:sugar/nucleoside kinase (ribokinase family)
MFHQGGGNAATAMVAAARLGSKAGFIAKVGADAAGDFIIKDFVFNGVDTSCILRDEPGSTSHFVIAISEVDLGTRLFIGRPSTVKPLTPEELDYDYISQAKCMHLEFGNPISLPAAKFAKEKGITVVVDAAGYREERMPLIPYVDVFIASEMFYTKLFSDDTGDYRGNLEKLHAMGPSVVWVTLGTRGSVGLVDGKLYTVPTFDVPVKDTTGCGDVFHGAYIAAMLDGLPHPECSRYASAVSSVKCMYPGGRTGIPNKKILERFLQDGTILNEDLEERLDYYRKSFLSHS